MNKWSSPAREVRCTACGAVLGKLERGGLAITRGDLQATFVGAFCAALVCYRCQKLNVLPFQIETVTRPLGGADE